MTLRLWKCLPTQYSTETQTKLMVGFMMFVVSYGDSANQVHRIAYEVDFVVIDSYVIFPGSTPITSINGTTARPHC